MRSQSTNPKGDWRGLLTLLTIVVCGLVYVASTRPPSARTVMSALVGVLSMSIVVTAGAVFSERSASAIRFAYTLLNPVVGALLLFKFGPDLSAGYLAGGLIALLSCSATAAAARSVRSSSSAEPREPI